jgi:hypothetical protein
MTGVIWGIAIPTIWAFTLVVAYWLGRVDSWESHRVTHELDLTLLSRTKEPMSGPQILYASSLIGVLGLVAAAFLYFWGTRA